MAPRLRNVLVLLLAPVLACDDPVGPDPAAVADLDLGVVAPAFVQAGDSFDVAIVVRNETDRPSAELVLDLCYRRVMQNCKSTEVAAIGAVGAGGEETLTVRTAFAVETVVLGGSGNAELCLRDPQGETNCASAPIEVGPDLIALCDPAIRELPLTDNSIDYSCSEAHPLLIVLGIEAEADHMYIFDIEAASYYGFGVYAPDGVRIWTVGSRPDGKWFSIETAGLYYIAATAPTHFAFAASDGGPFPISAGPIRQSRSAPGQPGASLRPPRSLPATAGRATLVENHSR